MIAIRMVLRVVYLCYGIQCMAQNYYFPPVNNTSWSTTNPQLLGWKINLLPDLQTYLDSIHSKAFIVLKDGKIVLEYYFNGHDVSKPWYWASAGKSLTSTLVAFAEAEGKLKLEDATAKYLSAGWTSCDSTEESKIKIIHQITMTTGLNEKVSFDCTDPACLQCIAVPGVRWSYHNSPYTLLDPVLESATKMNLNQYFKTRLGDKIGMQGLYIQSGNNNVFYSTARSMARFGLFILAKGSWEKELVLQNASYLSKMSNSSQSLNPSYGYLWWLNGKEKFMLPGSQLVFNGSLVPTAPKDMFAALGKNDQKLYIVPSHGLVIVRMGDQAGSKEDEAVPIGMDLVLWKKLSVIMNLGTLHTDRIPEIRKNKIIWNRQGNLVIDTYADIKSIEAVNASGQIVFKGNSTHTISTGHWTSGIYFIKAVNKKGDVYINRILVDR